MSGTGLGWPALVPPYRNRLEEWFSTPEKLHASFDTREELVSLLRACDNTLLESSLQLIADALLEWHADNARTVASGRRESRRRLTECLPSVPGTGLSLHEHYNQIALQSPLALLPVLRKRKLATDRVVDRGARATEEIRLRQEYALRLAAIMQEAQLPVCKVLAGVSNAEEAWPRLFGTRRSKTLRNRFRAWDKFREWLLYSRGRSYPEGVADVLDYANERFQEGCGKTVLESLQASLSVIEGVGRVPSTQQISQDPTWQAQLKSYTADLVSAAPPEQPASMLTVAIVLACEIFVCTPGEPSYLRALGFVCLLMVWGSLRADDVQGLLPQTMLLDERGLSIDLARSKTTGPDKRTHTVKVFVERSISLTGHDWLKVGYALWKDFDFERDYLVLKANEGFTEPLEKSVPSSTVALYFRKVLSELKTPKREGRTWKANDQRPLLPGYTSSHFTGHSARNFLSSVGAAIDVDPRELDYLGRWKVGGEGSATYIRTSRQVVHRLQSHIACSLVTGQPKHYIEVDSIKALTDYAAKAGESESQVRRRHTLLEGSKGLGGSWPTLALEVGVAAPPSPVEQVSMPGSRGDYFIVTSRTTGLRRLHMLGCYVKPENCYDVKFVSHVGAEDVDNICKDCKARMKAQAGEEESDPSSSDSGSESMRFQAIADSRPEARAAGKADFGLDDGAADGRQQIAGVVAAWELARDVISKETETRAEAKVLGQPRILQVTERQAMLKAVAAVHGQLGESETPSSEYLALKCEECEANEPQASTLDAITSKKNTLTTSIQSSLDLKLSDFDHFVNYILGEKETYFTTPLALSIIERPRKWHKGKGKDHIAYQPQLYSPSGLRVLYIFAGPHRKGDVGSYLQSLGNVTNLLQFDLQRSTEHDLTKEGLWQHIFQLLGEGDWSLIVEQANYFLDQTVTACQLAWQYVLEHPEDLGATPDHELPASIWQLPALRELQVSTQAITFAFFQCSFEAPTSKPTRLLTNLRAFVEQPPPFASWPRFDSSDRYVGPLPPRCPHGKHDKVLAGREGSRWATESSAAYPPLLCEWLAHAVLASASQGGLGSAPHSSVPGVRTHRFFIESPDSGLYRKGGGLIGLRSACKGFPASTEALASFVRSNMPGHPFTTISLYLNTGTKPHKDSRNAPLPNGIIGVTDFVGGEIWVEAQDGESVQIVDGKRLSGHLLPISETPTYIHAYRDLHLTMPWKGKRLVIIAFSVSEHTQACDEDLAFLRGHGFVLPGEEHSVDLEAVQSDDSEVLEGGEVERPEPFKHQECHNIGLPLNLEWDGKTQPITDGFGLCSPTRWPPEARGGLLPKQALEFATAMHQVLRDFVADVVPDIKRTAMELALGRLKESPFTPEMLGVLRKDWFSCIEVASGGKCTDLDVVPSGQPFFLHAVSATARLLQDPDWKAVSCQEDSYVSGVAIGYDCPVAAARSVKREGVAFRTDAKCADGYVVLGGWDCAGTTQESRWFSLRLTPSEAPYLFDSEGHSQWASASAELLATLAALHIFGHLEAGPTRRLMKVEVLAQTDNKSNEGLTRKGSTTRWPLLMVNMQLTHVLMKAGLRLNLGWRPRDENQEADDLTNEIFDRFSEELRVPVQYSELPLSFLHTLYEARRAQLSSREVDSIRDTARETPAEGRAEQLHLGEDGKIYNSRGEVVELESMGSIEIECCVCIAVELGEHACAGGLDEHELQHGELLEHVGQESCGKLEREHVLRSHVPYNDRPRDSGMREVQIDKFFYKGLAFLVLVLVGAFALGVVPYREVSGSRGPAAKEAMLNDMSAWSRSVGLVGVAPSELTVSVKSDIEGVVKNLAQSFADGLTAGAIEVVDAPVGRHAVVAERAVRTIKEGANTLCAGLEQVGLEPCGKGVTYLLMHVAQVYNRYQVHPGSALSPEQRCLKTTRGPHAAYVWGAAVLATPPPSLRDKITGRYGHAAYLGPEVGSGSHIVQFRLRDGTLKIARSARIRMLVPLTFEVSSLKGVCRMLPGRRDDAQKKLPESTGENVHDLPLPNTATRGPPPNWIEENGRTPRCRACRLRGFPADKAWHTQRCRDRYAEFVRNSFDPSRAILGQAPIEEEPTGLDDLGAGFDVDLGLDVPDDLDPFSNFPLDEDLAEYEPSLPGVENDIEVGEELEQIEAPSPGELDFMQVEPEPLEALPEEEREAMVSSVMYRESISFAGASVCFAGAATTKVVTPQVVELGGEKLLVEVSASAKDDLAVVFAAWFSDWLFAALFSWQFPARFAFAFLENAAWKAYSGPSKTEASEREETNEQLEQLTHHSKLVDRFSSAIFS
ncbi:unnamed protein product [Symbiodinium sp. CCMP2592]|nr:unnamed protein product [Symbiodinium sp. CCMP2592]